MVDEALLHMLPDANITHIRRKYLDVAYADRSDFERLDIYLPDEGDGPFPTIVFIHGGAWYACDKRDTQVEPFLTLLPHGYAVVSVNYRLSDEAIFPAGLLDCKAALRFLKANAMQYGLDADRMALAGQSAGANYVLMLVTTEGNPALEDLSMGWAGQNTAVRCAVSWYAPTDIFTMYEQLRQNGKQALAHDDPASPEARYLGGRLDSVPLEQIQMASPLHHIRPNMPPILLQHGDNDSLVPYQQSVTFHELAKTVGNEGNITLELFHGAEHADPAFETPESMERVRIFFDTYLKQGV